MLSHPPVCSLCVSVVKLDMCPLYVCCMCVLYSESPISPLPFLPSPVYAHVCGQALERQKEYFDCIRKERDELRDELADIKGKAKSAEVGLCHNWPFYRAKIFQYNGIQIVVVFSNWPAKSTVIYRTCKPAAVLLHILHKPLLIIPFWFGLSVLFRVSDSTVLRNHKIPGFCLLCVQLTSLPF